MPPIVARAAVFLLAFLSFACLLGTFYGFWSMRAFACAVLVPSTLALVGIAALARREWHRPASWVVEGAVAGVVAACAYDLFRLPFVLNGYPLFKVFPRFGELLLGTDEPRWLVHAVGWAYHFSNGACLGIMFLSACPSANRRVIFFGCVAWALVVEGALLASDYTSFFGLPYNGAFVALTASAHLVFGVALGAWLARRAPPRNLPHAAPARA